MKPQHNCSVLLPCYSLGPDQGLGPLHWVDLIRLVWHYCDSPGWKSSYPVNTGGGKPREGLSCLSRNVWHFNRQSHITGPLSFIRVLKNAEFSLYGEKKPLSVCLCWCFMQLCNWETCPSSAAKGGGLSRCPSSAHADHVMRFQAKNVHLSLSTTNSGSESQSQHNITTSVLLLNSFWRHS